jgi:DNA-directed RNA polymerase subunit RPC12/RpoP
MTAGPSRHHCPRCSSDRIVPIDAARDDPGADELSADAPTPDADPPNMRCEACGHRWWRAPHAAPMAEGEEGVRQ